MAELAREIKEHVLPYRTIEAIKSHRKASKYRDLVARGEPQEPAPELPRTPGAEVAPSELRSKPRERRVSQEHQEQGTLPDDISRDDERTPEATAPHNLLREALAASSSVLIVPIPQTLADVEHQVELWMPSKPPKQQRNIRRRTIRDHNSRKRRKEYTIFQKQYKQQRGKIVKRVL